MVDLVALLKSKKMKRIDLANALNVDKGTVTRWVQRGIPHERVTEVSAVTGIPAKQLRPDLAALFAKPASQPERAA